MPLFLLRGVVGNVGKSFRSRRHKSARLFSLLPFSLSFSLFFPSSRTPTVDFTRHEIGRPNKANCRTFLAGWRRRRENEGVAVPLRAFACFSAVTLSWQSTGTRCCYRCRARGHPLLQAAAVHPARPSSVYLARSSSPSNESYAMSNDGYRARNMFWQTMHFKRILQSSEEPNRNN